MFLRNFCHLFPVLFNERNTIFQESFPGRQLYLCMRWTLFLSGGGTTQHGEHHLWWEGAVSIKITGWGKSPHAKSTMGNPALSLSDFSVKVDDQIDKSTNEIDRHKQYLHTQYLHWPHREPWSGTKRGRYILK